MRPRVVLIGVGALAVVAVAVGGALCHFVFDCHLRGGHRSHPAPRPAPGFVDETVVRGLVAATSFAFVPDGRILFAEKVGRVRAAEAGRLIAKPLLDIRFEVDDSELRGLLGLAVDPHFEKNGYIYVDYVHTGGRKRGPGSVRVSRFTVHGGVADPSTERVILGRSADPSCTGQRETADCIPVDGYHAGGDLEFAADGTLFVTTGDGGFGNGPEPPRALRAQSLDSLSGKVLHVTRYGRGLPSNPFWNGNPQANRSKVWAFGLRNPFRIGLARPDLLYAGDVGWNRWEELDAVRPGRNYGWPCYEGFARVRPYAESAVCRALYAQGSATAPLLVRGHPRAISIVGGPLFEGASYPRRYRGVVVYGDFDTSSLRTVRPTRQDGAVTGSDRVMVEDATLPVQIRSGLGGNVYYLSFAGALHRISYERR